MEIALKVLQVVAALGIFNVWLLRYGKQTAWRGGSAQSLKEEFEVYGLPGWFMGLVGSLKLLFAVLLLAGLWFPMVTRFAAGGLAILMIGAITMHMKVRDPLKKSLPASIMLVLCLLVAFL